MNISLKKTVFGHKLSFQARRITKVKGINSNLKNGKHILMWEFDITERKVVEEALAFVQAKWGLPDIQLASSHPGGGFHAYCFIAYNFTAAIHVLSGTPWVDPAYIRMSCIRQHMTLRLTDKGQGAPSYLATLPGYTKPLVDASDLVSYVEYETYKRPNRIIEVE